MNRKEMNLLQMFGEDRDMAADPGQQEQGRMSWEQLMEDPEYNARMQAVVRTRLKSARAAEETLEELKPMLRDLAQRHQLDAEDIRGISQAVRREEAFRSLEPGGPLTRDREAVREHLRTLERQGEKLRERIPDFDIHRELQNPVFVRMTAPGSGISLEDAYFATHKEQMQQLAMDAAARMLSNSIQAGSRRPLESGTSSQAPSMAAFDYRQASQQERTALKKRILDESAQGRKVYPGM